MTALEEGYVPQLPPPTPPPPIPNTPGERVRWLRETRGISLRDACAMTGVSRGDWFGIEKGHRGPRFLENLRLISVGLANERGQHVNLAWLQCLDIAPPFPRSVTGSNKGAQNRRAKSSNRQNTVYCSKTRAEDALTSAA